MRTGPVARPLAERFWEKVRKADGDACWEWTAFCLPNGYGTIGLGAKAEGKEMAHRVAWMLTHGPIPEGLWVLHRCDNPPCVRPDHLFLGTRADNIKDMLAKGRDRHVGSPGSRHHRAKISEDAIGRICELRRDGLSQSQIGQRVGLTQAQVSGILRGSYWSHVPRPEWFKHERGKYHRLRAAT